MPLLSRHQVRQVDRIAIQELGLPGVVLMENAGRNAAAVVIDLLEAGGVPTAGARVAVLAGGGNNGGDGYVIARHLHNRGVAVTVYAAVEGAKLSGDAAVNHAVCGRMGLRVHPVITTAQLHDQAPRWAQAHVLVDALLGTGFAGSVRSGLAEVIRCCNALAGVAVVAVDLPSGLDCDTGEPSNATIRADVTVTFVAEKKGFANPAAGRYTGRVVVADIGCPPQLIERVLDAEGGFSP